MKVDVGEVSMPSLVGDGFAYGLVAVSTDYFDARSATRGSIDVKTTSKYH